MKAVKIFCCLVFVATFAGFVSAQRTSKVYADGELLVKFKKASNKKSVEQFHEQFGAEAVESFADLGWQRVKLPENLSIKEALELYRRSEEIEAVQPNYYYRLLSTPNDPQFSSMYGLQKISAPAAWDLTIGSASTVVAVIDTGAKLDHEDLAANIWTNAGEINNNGVDDDGNGFIDDFYGYDFFYNDSNPSDENGHGTHTAGTIGAVGNNLSGVTGVNWNVRLMTIKIYDSDGFGTTAAMLINAYNYVRMMKNRGVNIRVTNNSYGGCDEACGYDQATKDAIDALGATGVLQVFSAGNSNQNLETTPFYPTSYTTPGILAVASSTSTDSRSSFSNYGAASVDIAAPGSGILSTYTSPLYATLSGTSMAGPHAAGAAALLSSYNPNLSASSLKATIMNTVDVLSEWNGVVKTGGRLNAARALQNQTTCGFAFDRPSAVMRTKGGYLTINVATGQNCDYSVKSNAKWIQIASANSLSGNGAVTFRVAVNPGISRTGTITIGGQNFTVTQSRN